MKLTGQQFSDFEQALLSAYPTISNLTRMVRFKLEENLTQIADGGNLIEIVFNLIIWAESKGRILELITKSHDYNPDNPLLKNFASQFSTPQADSSTKESPNSSVAQPTPSSQPVKKMTIIEMRSHLNQYLDDAEQNALCLAHFPSVYDKFSEGMRKDSKITLLLDHCRRVDARKEELQKALEEFCDR